MKSVIFVFALTILGLSQAQAEYGQRDVQCTTKLQKPYCAGETAYRCNGTSGSCGALKIAFVRQSVYTSFFEDRVLVEYLMPAQNRSGAYGVIAYEAYRTKNECAKRCRRDRPAEDDAGTPGSGSGSGSGPAQRSCSISSIDCAFDEHCINGACVPRGAANTCGGPYLCSPGETCVNGVCQR